MPTARAGGRIRASVPRLGLLLRMGAGMAYGGQTRLVGASEINWGGKPLASYPSPQASRTKEATGPAAARNNQNIDKSLGETETAR